MLTMSRDAAGMVLYAPDERGRGGNGLDAFSASGDGFVVRVSMMITSCGVIRGRVIDTAWVV